MASVRPFNGLLYNKRKVGPLDKVVAPPYDIISRPERAALAGRSRYNIVRLILSGGPPKGRGADDRYRRASRLFRKWLERGILTDGGGESIYLYSQAYRHKGRPKEGIGFIALLKLEEPQKGIVFPHEHINASPKRDRFNLMKEVGANLSPIFSLFSDSGKVIRKIKERYGKTMPSADILLDGVRHRLWRIGEKDAIRTVVSQLKSKKIFIADGHHRYEAALELKRFKEKGGDRSGRYDYVMNYLSDFDEGSLTILPVHRILRRLRADRAKEMHGRLAGYFEIEGKRALEALLEAMAGAGKRGYRFGLYRKGTFSLLRLKRHYWPASAMPQWKKLDAAVFDDIILSKVLRMAKPEKPTHLSYSKDGDEVIKSVDQGRADAGFFLRPVKAEEIKKIAMAGDKMPQKSTYFYPKLLTGLVINKF